MPFLPTIALMMQSAGPMPPLPDWPLLSPLPYRNPPVVTPMMTKFVADQVATGRCTIERPADRHYVVRLDVAVLLSPDGEVRNVVPHAIACPTIEQYGAGLVIGFARDNVGVLPGAKANQWFRTTLTFDWTE